MCMCIHTSKRTHKYLQVYAVYIHMNVYMHREIHIYIHIF